MCSYRPAHILRLEMNIAPPDLVAIKFLAGDVLLGSTHYLDRYGASISVNQQILRHGASEQCLGEGKMEF